MIPTLTDLDVTNKHVLVRVDFNVPIDAAGAITDDTRIRASIPTIKYILDRKGSVILASHLGRPKGKDLKASLAPCAKRLSELLGIPVQMASDCVGDEVEARCRALKPGECLLLENVRFYPAEEKPELDPSFAHKLSTLGDLYVNDAFGTAHRAHSSTTTVAKYFVGRRACGFLLQKEIAFLGTVLKEPKRPFFAVIGGAKVSTKIGVLNALLDKVDALFLGGAMAYTFLKAKNVAVGDSPVEQEMLDMARQIMEKSIRKKVALHLPVDIVAATEFAQDSPHKTFEVSSGISAGYQGMDIGPQTIRCWTEALQSAKTILWNGPVGVFEFAPFSVGTNAIAKELALQRDVITIVGGGDSVAAVEQAGLADKMSHISTGGGASLEYLELGTLPGIEALSEEK
jgi:phosphoglycerate kinase